MSDQLYINFDEYIRQGEPAQRERAGTGASARSDLQSDRFEYKHL